MPSARPVNPSFSVVVALMLTRPGAMPRRRRPARHRCAMGADPGPFADIVTSTAATAPPALGRDRGIAQGTGGGRAAPAVVAGRNAPPMYACPDRPEHGIGQGMKPDISVRMTPRLMLWRDLDAAYPEMITGQRDGRRSPARRECRLVERRSAARRRRSCGVVTFRLSSLPSTITGHTRRFGDRCVIREGQANGGAVAARIASK